jgi:hypothetical protein
MGLNMEEVEHGKLFSGRDIRWQDNAVLHVAVERRAVEPDVAEGDVWG